MTLSVGIIGYKNHATRLIKLIDERSDVELKSIYHPTKLLNDNRFTNKLVDLLSNDAIIISSPDHTHLDYIQTCLNGFRGFILCEKPPVSTLEQLVTLEELDNKCRSRVYFNFNYRFSLKAKIIQDLLQNGEFGDVLDVNIATTHGLAFKDSFKGSWRSEPEKHMHAIVNVVGIHYIDMLTYFFGYPIAYSYFPSVVANPGCAYDTARFSLQFKNQQTATIYVSYASPYRSEFEILATNGLVKFSKQAVNFYHPRDTFTDEGFFTYPPASKTLNYCSVQDYNDSLKSSLDFFLDHAKAMKPFEQELFNNSIQSMKLLLDITSQ